MDLEVEMFDDFMAGGDAAAWAGQLGGLQVGVGRGGTAGGRSGERGKFRVVFWGGRVEKSVVLAMEGGDEFGVRGRGGNVLVVVARGRGLQTVAIKVKGGD